MAKRITLAKEKVYKYIRFLAMAQSTTVINVIKRIHPEISNQSCSFQHGNIQFGFKAGAEQMGQYTTNIIRQIMVAR